MTTHQEQQESAGAAPAVGWQVFSSEGLPIGRIDDLRGGRMHIDVRMRRDYWLSLADVVSTEQDAVTLAYPREALEQHKLGEPAAADGEALAGGDAAPVLLDEHERRLQRERMERALAEQRARLHTPPPGMPGGTVGEPVEQELARMEAEDRAAAPAAPPAAVEPRAAAARGFVPFAVAAATFTLVLIGVALLRGRGH